MGTAARANTDNKAAGPARHRMRYTGASVRNERRQRALNAGATERNGRTLQDMWNMPKSKKPRRVWFQPTKDELERAAHRIEELCLTMKNKRESKPLQHYLGRREKVLVLHHSSLVSHPDVQVGVDVEKVVIVDLSRDHYTLIVVNIGEQEIKRLDGFRTLADSAVDKSYISLLFHDLNRSVLRDFNQYSTRRSAYLKQSDGASWGPIVVLAL